VTRKKKFFFLTIKRIGQWQERLFSLRKTLFGTTRKKEGTQREIENGGVEGKRRDWRWREREREREDLGGNEWKGGDGVSAAIRSHFVTPISALSY
jgi:hypothetical protein